MTLKNCGETDNINDLSEEQKQKVKELENLMSKIL